MNKDIMFTSLETITAFDPVTGAYMFTIDELQDASLNNAEEKVDLTGKQGRKIGSLKRNKTVTISGTSGIVSGGLMSAQVGSKFVDGTTEIMWTDYLTVNGGAATTSFKAVGTAGNEIDTVYVKGDSGEIIKELEQNAAVGAGKFTYTPDTKALAFHSDIADGTEIVVYYKRKIATGSTLSNMSDKHAGKAMLYIDMFGEDKCGKVYRVQFFIPKADFSGNFDFNLGGEQTVHGFEAEALAGACGAGGAFWTYTIFGVDEEDA